MPPTSTPTHVRRGRARTALGAAALAAVLALVAAGCDVPSKPAGAVFDAWKAGNQSAAATNATAPAVTSLFSKPWKSADQWFFSRCDGTAGADYCTWLNIVETRLTLKVTNQFAKVTEVTRTPVASGVAGHLFHDWRVGDKTNAAVDGTTTAINQLFAHTYKAADHWFPSDECEGAAGALYCSWTSDGGHELALKYDQASTHKVVQVLYDPA